MKRISVLELTTVELSDNSPITWIDYLYHSLLVVEVERREVKRRGDIMIEWRSNWLYEEERRDEDMLWLNDDKITRQQESVGMGIQVKWNVI